MQQKRSSPKSIIKLSYVDRWAGANHVHRTATVVCYELRPTWELCAVWTTIHSKSPNYAALQAPPIFALQISVEEMDVGNRHVQILF